LRAGTSEADHLEALPAAELEPTPTSSGLINGLNEELKLRPGKFREGTCAQEGPGHLPGLDLMTTLNNGRFLNLAYVDTFPTFSKGKTLDDE
jgi:hypothetical protein